MEVGCELQVDVNGQQIFVVDKNLLACFSGRFRKLFSKLTGSTGHLKVIFQDFPGGADGFELVASFCYNNGTVEITPSNIALLNSAAYFMEMSSNGSAPSNLIDQTENFLRGINCWTWSELLLAMRQCQDLSAATNSSSVLEKILDSFIERLALLSVANPYTCSSSENFSSQLSSDTSSSSSSRNIGSPTTWWFEDLMFLDVNLFEKIIRKMVYQKLDHITIFKLLIFYLKSKFLSVAAQAEKRRIMEVVINLLSLLDRGCLSCKGLFNVLRIVSRLKRTSKCCKLKLERLIGSKLDQTTLDQLLVRSPPRNYYMYDVNLVLRLAEAYVLECWMFSPTRLKKVSSLIDSYLIEVAPDNRLEPSKFAALSMVLPDSGRESSDRIYQAIDLYLQVHTELCKEEKIRLCCALNYEKLSAEALKHLAQNPKFPSRRAVQDFVARQSGHNNSREEGEQVHYARKHGHLTEISDLEVHLQQMQRRVSELEKVCTTMREPKKLCYPAKIRYLPKFCS